MSIKDRINKVERKIEEEHKSSETEIVIVRDGDNEEELVAQAEAMACDRIVVIKIISPKERIEKNKK